MLAQHQAVIEGERTQYHGIGEALLRSKDRSPFTACELLLLGTPLRHNLWGLGCRKTYRWLAICNEHEYN